MNILVIFTGGTIGSSVIGSTISANQGNAYLLIDLFKKRTGRDVNFFTVQPYYALSENNTGEQITRLIACVSSALKEEYDGIIVTHGTDTLQYTAAALSCAFGSCTAPIVLVSSNFVLTDERANGIDNFVGAVNFIEQRCGSGVFVSYKNTGGVLHIHRASRLLAHNELDDAVYSVKNQFYGLFENEKFVKNKNYTAKKDEIKPFGEVNLGRMSDEIMVINSYVGFKFPRAADNVKAVIIRAYHSGTLCTDEESFADFALDLKARGIPCFICGAEGKTIYESAEVFTEYGLKILPPASFISQYIKLWYTVKSNFNIEKAMLSSIGEDILIG